MTVLQFADLRHLLPPNHPGHTMIKIQLGINRQSPEEGDLEACDLLLRVFPSCQMIMGLKAQVLYHMNCENNHLYPLSSHCDLGDRFRHGGARLRRDAHKGPVPHRRN